MPKTIFYAWQSDRPSSVCRGFIREVLDEVAAGIAADAAAISEPDRAEIIVDQDTQGISGSPHVSDTIFQKIEAADVFVADLTFVTSTQPTASSAELPATDDVDRVKLIPNPNVLLEYGYAARALGYNKVVAVMNSHYGAPDKLPFDLRFRRYPAVFNLAPSGPKSQVRADLARELKRRIEPALAEPRSGITSYEHWRDLDGIDLNTASAIWAGTREDANVVRHLLFRRLKLAARQKRLKIDRLNGPEPNIKSVVKPADLKAFLDSVRDNPPTSEAE